MTDQCADTDGLAHLRDPLAIARLWDRVAALEALVLAIEPAGYVPLTEIARLREAVAKGRQS